MKAGKLEIIVRHRMDKALGLTNKCGDEVIGHQVICPVCGCNDAHAGDPCTLSVRRLPVRRPGMNADLQLGRAYRNRIVESKFSHHGPDELLKSKPASMMIGNPDDEILLGSVMNVSETMKRDLRLSFTRIIVGYRICVLLLFSISVGALASGKEPTLDTSQVPGTVIAHYPKSEGMYVGSPGIAIVGPGIYIAKHDEFGPKSSEFISAITHLYRSEDAGISWRRTNTIDGLFWASIFTFDDHAYLLGTDKHHGNVVIFRSRDRGLTWTKPTDAENGLLRSGENHTAPVPVVLHNGRVWRAIEDAGNGDKWGVRYGAMMMSAPAQADLLKASSWTFSNYITRDPAWLGGKFNAWLEGNAVVTKEGKVINILRVDYTEGGIAAIARISDDGRQITFDPEHDLIDFPGGATKFTIRRDPHTKLYWTLSNYTPEFHRSVRAASTRNTLALVSSPDLRQWTVRCVVLYHPDEKYHAFQYVDWLIEGDDLIFTSRTAYDDGLGGAHRFHDANFLTFHRIKNFRNLDMTDSTLEYLKRWQENK